MYLTEEEKKTRRELNEFTDKMLKVRPFTHHWQDGWSAHFKNSSGCFHKVSYRESDNEIYWYIEYNTETETTYEIKNFEKSIKGAIKAFKFVDKLIGYNYNDYLLKKIEIKVYNAKESLNKYMSEIQSLISELT